MLDVGRKVQSVIVAIALQDHAALVSDTDTACQLMDEILCLVPSLFRLLPIR
jgi:hypothetical protein